MPRPFRNVVGRWARLNDADDYLRDHLDLIDDHLLTVNPDDTSSRVKITFDNPWSRVFVDLRAIGGSLRRLTLRPGGVGELKRRLSEGTFAGIDRASIRAWHILETRT